MRCCVSPMRIAPRLTRAAGRPACLRDVVTTSGRRWDVQGALRTMATMWRLRFDFLRGISAWIIAERYGERRLPTLQVFARGPVAGTVKTRLAAATGAERAASFYRMLVERTLATAQAARAQGYVGDVELWCASSLDAASFKTWRDRFGVVLMPQCAGDSGHGCTMRSAPRLHALPARFDIDTAEDLARYEAAVGSVG